MGGVLGDWLDEYYILSIITLVLWWILSWGELNKWVAFGTFRGDIKWLATCMYC